jgi:hypothetical protein
MIVEPPDRARRSAPVPRVVAPMHATAAIAPTARAVFPSPSRPKKLAMKDFLAAMAAPGHYDQQGKQGAFSKPSDIYEFDGSRCAFLDEGEARLGLRTHQPFYRLGRHVGVIRVHSDAQQGTLGGVHRRVA